MTREWTVTVTLDERGDVTTAEAVVTVDARGRLSGQGESRRNPQDPSVPQIGEELATARALSDLAHRLLEAAAADIEASTHLPAHLSS